MKPTRGRSIEVAVATDATYLPWCATLIRSCIEQHACAVRIHLLHDGGLDPADVEALRRMVESSGAELNVPIVDFSPLSVLRPQDRFGGLTAVLRLLLPSALPELSRVIYLDVDTFVVEPLTDLWTTALGGRCLAAVKNVVEPAMVPHIKSLGLDDPSECFNSGVMLIDLDAVRADGLFGATIDVLSRLPSAPWFDQDALNIVFAKRWLAVHPRWNAMNSLWMWAPRARKVFGPELLREAKTSPAILHFEGPSIAKPWHYLNDHPWRDEYRRTLAQTPWADAEVHDRTLATRLIGRLPRRWRLRAYIRLLGWRAKLMSAD